MGFSALCDAYASLTPGGIAELAAKAITTQALDYTANAAFGPGGGELVAWSLARAANSFSLEQKRAWANKLVESIGPLEDWGCAQVASMRGLVVGFSTSEIERFSDAALAGIFPDMLEEIALTTTLQPGNAGDRNASNVAPALGVDVVGGTVVIALSLLWT